MEVRPEARGEEGAISRLISAAFLEAEHRDGTEASVVDKLRAAGGLSVSLVAAADDGLVGHVAFSPVTIDGLDLGWFGLGPVAVLPGFQRFGIGTTLIKDALARLIDQGAKGCVVLGDPGYYSRFGFAADAGLWLADVPPEYFQAITLRGARPRGQVNYHTAFGLN